MAFTCQKGLWALIMAQTGLGVFAGEQIGAFVLRMGGTLAVRSFGHGGSPRLTTTLLS
jgi:hypothetical protein